MSEAPIRSPIRRATESVRPPGGQLMTSFIGALCENDAVGSAVAHSAPTAPMKRRRFEGWERLMARSDVPGGGTTDSAHFVANADGLAMKRE